ncbi:hypothetical protein TNCV_2066601 [Trichonephila clavipes]|uniref:Uncharacterized protein n=1 Tax=Trichonephila clavipes TaxID=2585209 RepID=A0A8X6W2Q2_TRICX|nr:hypothetical protein TNCV_2066601 [Trichonephila clavipes]
MVSNVEDGCLELVRRGNTLNIRRAECPHEKLSGGHLTPPPGSSPSKLECDKAKTYCHLHIATAHNKCNPALCHD